MSISVTQQELKRKLEVKLLYAWGGGVIIESINSVGDQRKVNIGLEKRRGGVVLGDNFK